VKVDGLNCFIDALDVREWNGYTPAAEHTYLYDQAMCVQHIDDADLASSSEHRAPGAQAP
jgi:hypothetical protein